MNLHEITLKSHEFPMFWSPNTSDTHQHLPSTGRDPTMGDVPYSKAVKPGREDILLAACLNNIGQALSYIGKAKGVFFRFNFLGVKKGQGMDLK